MYDAPKSLPSDPGELCVVAEGLVELAKAQALETEKLKHQLAGTIDTVLGPNLNLPIN